MRHKYLYKKYYHYFNNKLVYKIYKCGYLNQLNANKTTMSEKSQYIDFYLSQVYCFRILLPTLIRSNIFNLKKSNNSGVHIISYFSL